MSFWNNFRQWSYPPEFRIEVDRGETSTVLLAARLGELSDALKGLSSTGATATDSGTDGAAPQTAMERSFIIGLCNSFHRLCRSAKPLQDAGGSDGARLARSFDQMRKALQEGGIECTDLSGQAYDPGRSDFEPLGEPQPTPGLTRMTILQCERPMITIKGELIQQAKGLVGRPAAG